MRRDPVAKLFQRPGRADPYAVYAEIRSAGSFVRLSAGERATASHQVARTILRDRRFGVRPPGDPGPSERPAGFTGVDLGLLDRGRLGTPDCGGSGRRHSGRSRSLRSGSASRSSPSVLPARRAKGRFDLVTDFATPLPVAVITDLLGVDGSDTERLARHGIAVGTAIDGIRSLRHAASLMAASTELEQMSTELIERRRAEPGDDVVSRLVAASDEGELTAYEVLITCHLLLIAGFETTVNLIGNGVRALLEHPEQWAALCRDPSFAPAAVEEALRYDPPVQSTYRIAQQELEIDGGAFALGDGVHVLLAGGGRDRRVCDEPDVFDIRRVSPPRSPGVLRWGPLLRRRSPRPAGRRSRPGRPVAGMPLLARAGRPTRRPSVSIRGFARFPVSGGARGR